MKRAHDSQVVRAKENLKLSHGGSSVTDKYQAPTHQLKLYVRTVIESEAWPIFVQLKRKP